VQRSAQDADRVYLAAIDKFEAMMGMSQKYAPGGKLLFQLYLLSTPLTAFAGRVNKLYGIYTIAVSLDDFACQMICITPKCASQYYE
jgi:hypothetical protein